MPADGSPARWTAGLQPAARWGNPARRQGLPAVPSRAPGSCSLASGDAHAVFLEDDVRAERRRARRCWPTMAGFRPDVGGGEAGALRPARPARAADGLARRGRGFSAGPHAVAPYRRRGLYPVARGGANCCCARRASTCRWIIFCSIPTIRRCSPQLSPWQLLPAIARQQDFVGDKSDIEGTRMGLRAFGLTYVKRELVRFGYDLKLLPRQLAALLAAARSSWRCKTAG